MNDVMRFAGMIEVVDLGFLGNVATSPNRAITVAYGDRKNASSPSDKWLLVLRGDSVVYQARFPASIIRVRVTDRGLIVLDLYNQSTGTASFVAMHADGRILAKVRAAIYFESMIITPDEGWIIFEDGGFIRALDLALGKVTRKKALPSLRLESLRLSAAGTVEALMADGSVVTLQFPYENQESSG